MRKTAAIILIAIQMIFPAAMIGYDRYIESSVENKGTEYIFEAVGIIIYEKEDAENILFVSAGIPSDYGNIYARTYYTVETDENGLSSLKEYGNKRPDGDDYVLGDKYTYFSELFDVTSDSQILQLEKLMQEAWLLCDSPIITNGNTYNVYIKAKVLHGNIRYTGLIINGEEFVPCDSDSKNRN